jgi:hypothetical protein
MVSGNFCRSQRNGGFGIPVLLGATRVGALSAEAVRKPGEFCKQSRKAKFFAIFSLASGLRARKSEQNRPVL